MTLAVLAAACLVAPAALSASLDTKASPPVVPTTQADTAAAEAVEDATAQGEDKRRSGASAEAPVQAQPAPSGGDTGEGATDTEEEQGETSDERSAIKRAPKTITIPTKEGGVIYWLEVKETIDLGLAPYTERVVQAANEDPNAVAIVSEIQTPGGRVDAAVRMRDALLEAKVPTVAYINSEAISAGALIALAHEYIVIRPAGTIGAATPIQMGGGGQAQPVGEKMVSYVRGVFRATAEATDRDPVIAESMVDADVIVSGLAPKGKLLTATASEAFAWGLVDVVVEDEAAFMTATGLTDTRIEKQSTNWAELIARFLTHPMVSGLLMSLGFLGLLMELYSPGFGVIGGIGLSCLLAFFFGHYIVHLAGLEELAIFALGVFLLGVEVFVTPGFGVLGIAGLGCIVTSLAMAMSGLPIDVSFDSGELGSAATRVLIALAVTSVLGVFAITRFAKAGPFQRLVLADEIRAKGVGFGSDASGGIHLTEGRTDEAPPQGSEGVALTDLRPSGKVRVQGRTFDAISGGEFIPKDATIVVRETRHANLVVRRGTTPNGAQTA